MLVDRRGMEHTPTWQEQVVHHVWVVFHRELEELHDAEHRDVIFLARALVFYMMSLKLLEPLDLLAKACDLTRKVRKHEILGRHTEADHIHVAVVA